MDLSPDDDNFQGRLLHQAALWDNLELVQELLASGAAADARDSCQRSALHAAALAERSRCLAALCAAGAQVDACSDNATGGKTALHIAAERGYVENVKTLLAAGASLSVLDAEGNTPLALAERHSHRHAAHALREARDAVERERLSHHAALRELVTRGDIVQLRQRLSELGADAGLIANLTPGGANTLLYVASEAGLTGAVSALLEAGADGRAHPVTKYCPLYIACYHGHIDIVKLLLAAFPEAVQQETVEKWLPLHAACIGGHASLVTLLLEYPYPPRVLSTYNVADGKWQYVGAFDVNACDVSAQSALYVACTLGNAAVVDALLAHRTTPAPAHTNAQVEQSPTPAQTQTPQRSGISHSIHAIVSKLTGSNVNHDSSWSDKQICPVSVDVGRGVDSCVACVVRGGHGAILRRLLAAGADANASAAPPVDLTPAPESTTRDRRRSRSASAALAGPRTNTAPSPVRSNYNTDRESPWTALAIAARAKNVQLAEVLLQHGATDPQGVAIREAARHGLADLLDKLLATKAYPDPDYKLNKSTISEAVFHEREGDSTLTYSSLCPTTPVMVNWRELRAQIAYIRMSWIRAAALRVNSKLSRDGIAQAIHAITRLDISNNELRLLPPELFTMYSLRYLNAAQNKLERLPSADDPFEEDLEGKKRRKKKVRPKVYTAPLLQEIYLQDNRLEELPGQLFSLPSLVTLDVSNNKVRALPPELWGAPALRDLNVSLNHLRDLPTAPQNQTECSSPQQATSPSDSYSQVTSSSSTYNVTLASADLSKSSSRSPSIERSESETLDDDDDDAVPVLGDREGNAVCSEARRAHPWRGAVLGVEARPLRGGPPLATLNLAHNQFTCVPPALACQAPNLTALNMAYNSLRSMSYVTSYPTNLRQLDLSHNEITCWPSLPQIENFGSSEGDPLSCYCPNSASSARPRPRSGGSVRSQLLSAACPARRHLRLEGLRTLILSNNLLTRIQLTTDDDGYVSAATDEHTGDDDDDEWSSGSPLKGRLLFPLLSMLDVSCNLLRAVPPAIHELTNLSVLNISGNKDITDLPPQMGLLSRLWSLSATGCALQEPLRSMLTSGRYRSMDVVGYLKSVLQEARPYTRMKLMLVGLQGIGKTSLLECLRQESNLQHRRKPTEHWAKRMGNKYSSRGNMSTVGVDIGTWIYEKQRSAKGPVTFRTWDFGGQHEYYATHQYFLSRRSLYLVVWRVTDGRRGLAGAIEWLRSIQARAPSSPVIMVATHYDQVVNCNVSESDSPECLQHLIRSYIMGAPDADKLGLPRVLDSVEVSCSTRHNIRLLADIIYSIAFSVKPPGSKETLLEQRIPATYLALEECVTSLAYELKEPVLKHDEYKKLVTNYMQQKNHRMFRDAAELHQATMFLHENGVLLHYDDATLKELYFVRPQWLCDVLAHVVTVREINPFANNGIMKIDDLAHVFKASPLLSRGDEAWSLCVSLLNKFELALSWDSRLLLVPPLLPRDEPTAPQLPVRSRTWSSSTRGTPRRTWPAVLTAASDRGTDSPTLIQDSSPNLTIHGRCVGRPLRRLLLLSYVPCGFWARLCARLLADSQLAECTAPNALYKLPPELECDEMLSRALELSWGWKLWSLGVAVSCGALQLLRVRHLPARRDPLLPGADEPDLDHPYQHVRFRVQQEGAWCEVDVQSSACIEIVLPAHVCVIRRDDGLPIVGYQSISLEPNPETLTKVLALVSDHVDLLLEDWYPALGTRFVHTSEGKCLITRIVPCPECLRSTSPPGPILAPEHDHLAQAFRRLDMGAVEPRRLRLSEESRTSDGDSGVGAESNTSSRLGSVEGAPGGVAGGAAGPPLRSVTAWTVEQCILCACTARRVHCARHDELELRHVAPDTLLLDVSESLHARWEHIVRGPVLGRGAFGTVVRARWSRPHYAHVHVALKTLQPVPPPHNSDVAAIHAYKAAQSRWDREPTAGACRAYCGLRQELHILLPLHHPHVLPLIAVCAAPLALLLALAPQGALDGVLRSYRECGARCTARVVRALALQTARALEYLHDRRVVYRDLKSENVLVWQMPAPHEAAAAELSSAPLHVHVKLGDYGISRLALPSGTKGFGGTEGFMAPEIMRYNGEEEYNEKVDCFSYGMLLYEIVTVRQPFEGHEAVKEAVLEGARPALSPRDLEYPCCVLETMRRCWAGAPALRPSAAALVSVASAPEYTALCDAAAARAACAAAATPIGTSTHDDGPLGWEVWYGGGEPERVHSLLTTTTSFTHHHSVRLPPDKAEPVLVTAICRVGNKMWLGDSAGRISVYSASTCALVWSVRVQEAVGGAPSGAAVSAMQPLSALHRVAVALSCGRLFLVTSHRPEAEGSFVLTELGTATELCCLTAVPTPHGWEVWAGGDGLYSYSVNSAGVCGAETLQASPRVTLLAASDTEPYVAVYIDPGVCVLQWSVSSRRQVARLDCSKLAPCSESLQSIALDEYLSEDKCRVTALSSFRGSVYVGTAWGCIIVADSASLRPLTVFRPYEQDVRVLLPLPPHKEDECGMLATFGHGYRPLLQRYAPQSTNTTNNYNGYYCLLWRAQHWLPD